ncbi:hypothetical protein G7Z17_g703 [Cylindrodendrum hubeiense]|uniref:F-box domain-containing protein n=1 Tax=Cylindrodendrum hubeiense TaxID=595255 RepID=A0A9P5HG65_9HYPO|nr:hypothetical protein G7Z17_g703 [Cylindrodendrum hubeiense]
MDTVSLSHLSTETLLLICGHFCLHCQGEYDDDWDAAPLRKRQIRSEQQHDAKSWYSMDRDALFSLTLVSRRFRDIAQPFLYHEFVLGYGDSWRSESYSWHRRLTSFLRTTARRPELASLVKTVYIHPHMLTSIDVDEARDVILEAAEARGIDLQDSWTRRIPILHYLESSYPAQLRKDFLTYFLRGLGEAPLDVKERLEKALYKRRCEARNWLATELVVMLISQLPNLDHLANESGYVFGGLHLPQSAVDQLITSLPLKRLDSGGDYVQFLRLAPGLTTLNLNGAGLVDPGTPLPNLETVHITEARIYEYNLMLFLSSCTRGLQTFAYEAGFYAPFEYSAEDDPDGTLTPPPVERHCSAFAMVHHLRTHKTLRSIHLDLSEQIDKFYGPMPVLSFSDFGSLENLFLNSMLLYDRYRPEFENNPDSEVLIRLIPDSIVSLTIKYNQYRSFKGNDHAERLKNGLLGLAEVNRRQPARFPRLRRVTSDLRIETEALRSIFKEVGVEFDSQVWSLNQVKRYLNKLTDFDL